VTSLKKYDLTGKVLGQVEIEDGLLECVANSQMIKDYIVAIRANKRQWSANTKDKSEVNHTGAKPHPQKGTGKARQGSLASPQYKGGGVVFGPKPKFDQHVRINKKERRAAMNFLLSEKIKAGKLHVLKSTEMQGPKTKVVASFLKTAGFDEQKVLFLSEYEYPSHYVALAKSLRNIPKVKFINLRNINGYELMYTEHIVVMEPAFEQLTALLGRPVSS
jgi:large subunit ribosomal protein L4